MSVQYGRWNLDGRPINPVDLQRIEPMLRPYGPDTQRTHCKANVAVQYHAFHTTAESRMELQPHVTPSGLVLAWDGRLDNSTELRRRMDLNDSSTSTDLAIVAALYESIGNRCFPSLLGDWALSIWNAKAHCLILAKDFAGVRPLYYRICAGQITWCTVLEPLVPASEVLHLDEEYIAGWFGSFPAAHLTPYVGICSVPPSSFVTVTAGRSAITQYWDFDSKSRIRYPRDSEYEEHFRGLFAESVRRRLRSQSSVLSELSGGMDSSAIVCMGDAVLAGTAAPRLDTVSYYNDREPAWNERPYFEAVEAKRGRRGCHIDIGVPGSYWPEYQERGFAAAPGTCLKPTLAQMQFNAYLQTNGNRVLLSGIGGDEVLGGVPTPVPELADLFVRLRCVRLMEELVAWALAKRKPALHLIAETLGAFLPPAMAGLLRLHRPPGWLDARFVRRNRRALQGYPERLRAFGPLPTFQENLITLGALRRQLASVELPADPCFERRYPYLDRDLLAFLYAIPREQLVRPGQRRSLMRRALHGIVPDLILDRRRKAFVSRAATSDVSAGWLHSEKTAANLALSDLGFIDASKLDGTLGLVQRGSEVPILPLMRTFLVENWLARLGVLDQTSALCIKRVTPTCDQHDRGEWFNELAECNRPARFNSAAESLGTRPRRE